MAVRVRQFLAVPLMPRRLSQPLPRRPDAGGGPAVVTDWIAQTQAERARAEADLHQNAGNTRDG
ncbi:hypothetical protein [Micromonospora sp. IBHARD004]|uniref:hypothetical protein n=1 Tax=Micromonospora sp. IBHARD004 TaxID=3457764 RepID=UPI004058C63E